MTGSQLPPTSERRCVARWIKRCMERLLERKITVGDEIVIAERVRILSSYIFMTIISGLIWMLQHRRDAQI